MDGFLKDARLGFRMLLRTPLLSIVAILTIGLGVGATSFAFSVVYGTLGRGLSVRDADRLMAVSETRPEEGEDQLNVPLHDYLDLRDQQTSFEHLAAGYSGTINLGGEEGPPERYQGGFVTARMLSMLGVDPVLGRTFADGEDGPGAAPLVVLGHGVWRNRFGGEDVRGRSVRVNGELATIIGVMPEGFRFPFNEDLWVPLRINPDSLPRRAGTSLTVTGYLRDGVSIDAARAEVQAIAARMAEQFPQQNEGISATVQPYTDAFMPPQITMMLTLLMVMVIGVLLVACANVANVLLARSIVREKEVAIRSAMGATRWRVIQQLLLESVAIGVAGGLVGVLLAWVGLRFFNATLIDVQRPYWIQFYMDAPILVFTSIITLAAAVAAGTVPAIRAAGGRLEAVLRDESRGSSSRRVGRFSSGLVIGELAVSCALMIGAGLLIHALVDLNRTDMGFEQESVMTARLGLFDSDYPDADARSRFYHQLLERLGGEPGIVAATLTTALPATGLGGQFPVQVEGESYERAADVPNASGSVVTPGFFDTFGVSIVEGRDFRLEESRRGGEPVVIVNRSFADQRLGGGNVIGKRIRVGTGTGADGPPWLRVIGVVPDLHEGVGNFGSGSGIRAAIYQPLALSDPRFISVAVRTTGLPANIAGALRQAVIQLDPNLPLYWVRTMTEALDQTTFMHRIFGTMFGIFGAAALFLAAVGLYGVIDFSVSSRLREMGLRMALGAEPSDIVRMVYRRVLRQLGVGILVGLGFGALLARPLSATLFGVKGWDPIVYGAIVGTLVLSGCMAALTPALRAIRVHPAVAFRA